MVPESGAGSEVELIERLRKGERTGFDCLVAMYRQRGLGIALGVVGNLEDAKDALQEAFIKMYTHINGFRGRSQFSTWFYRIVVNCSLDLLRKKKRANRIFVRNFVLDKEGEERELEAPDTRFEPARVALQGELRSKLEEGLAGLSHHQRLCFVLKHQNGLSVQEIAEVLRCRPATVKVHLSRAVSGLQKRLSRYVREKGV